tara:strand:+ start:275 stop:673 length:399 start_codon:yes stop_codon:yes gene_type:complete
MKTNNYIYTNNNKVMNFLFTEIIAEKLRLRPNIEYIRKLQRLADKKDEIELKDFRKMARAISLDSKGIDKSLLHKDCKFIIKYFDDLYIQYLKTDEYYVKCNGVVFLTTTLANAEEYFWNNQVKEIIKTKLN